MDFPFNLQTYLKHPERFTVYYERQDSDNYDYVERLEWSENNKEVLIKLDGKIIVMTEGEARENCQCG